MVSQNVYCVGQVHEQQSAYDGVKGLLIDERARIALAEDDIAGIEVSPPPLGHCDLRGIPFDSDDGSVDTDHFGNLKRDVTGAATEVEYPHPGDDAATPQEHRSQLGDQGSL